MPKPDGLDVTRAPAGPGVLDPLRVVVVTTFDQDNYVHTALSNGACGFLLKDAGSALLIEAARGAALLSPAVTLRLLEQLQDRRPPSAHGAGAGSHPLTDRELDVARLVAVGRTNQEIRAELVLSLSTVKAHLTNIQTEPGVRNRVEIAAWAWENGAVRPPR